MTTRGGLLIALVIASLAAVASPSPASAQDPAGSTEQQLVERFAPIVMLKAQEAACDANGEPYAPSSVDIVLDNPEVVLRQLGDGNPVVKVGPSAADLYGLNEGFYLDFPGSAFEPGCLYEQDFDKYSDTTTGNRKSIVYANIAKQADEPDKLAVQYWIYWYYNDWNNKHESDWEGIQLLFDVGSVEEALADEPVSVGYAQHEGGERADWDSSKLTREGDRPVVYSSSGSHASYFGSALYIGRSGSEGFGCDTTDGPSDRTDPEVILIPTSASGPDDEFAWIDFAGRWGERQSGPFNGPTGPQDKERWANPVDWHDDLRAGSVVVPAGDSQGDAIINTFCSVVETGSGALITLRTSPLHLVVTLGLLFLIARFLVRRTVWDKVPAVPMIARRRAGQIIRAAASSYRRRSRLLITIGLVYVPAALVVAVFATVLQAIPLVSRVTDLAGQGSETSVTFALLSGGFFNLVAYVAVNAVVASYYDLVSARQDGDTKVSVVDAVRRAWTHVGDLATGFLIAFVIVTFLFVSVIGIPLGIWLLVRFQLMPQAVVVEDLDGPAGLRRSGQLVTGRWFHTAIVLALFNLLIVVSVGVIGLLLLVAIPGVPLWLFSALVSLVYALIVPLAAVGQTLLYGDAVAQHRETEHSPTQDLVTA